MKAAADFLVFWPLTVSLPPHHINEVQLVLEEARRALGARRKIAVGVLGGKKLPLPDVLSKRLFAAWGFFEIENLLMFSRWRSEVLRAENTEGIYGDDGKVDLVFGSARVLRPWLKNTVPDKKDAARLGFRMRPARACGLSPAVRNPQALRALLQQRLFTRAAAWEKKGVFFEDLSSLWMDAEVRLAPGARIASHVQLFGKTVIGPSCVIGSFSVLQDARLERGVRVVASRVVESFLGAQSDVGPFAHLRAGCRLEKGVHVGTNAELKNARVGEKCRIGHFSYVGDARLGRSVNVGAGCVFANFDGKRKHRTIVADGVFLGSNSTLIAPIRIGEKAVVGAGAVVTRSVPARAVVVGVPAKPIRKSSRRTM